MMRAAWVLGALLLAPQEETVDALLAKIDGKDSRTAFRAIARLVAMGPARSQEIEAAASKLPEFYRAALLSELKVRGALGDHFGKELKVTLKAGTQAAPALLTELDKQAGFRVEPGHWLRRGPGDPIEVEPGERTPLEALADICVKTKHAPYFYGNGAVVLNQTQCEVKPYCYRNFAVFVTAISMWRKSDFSGETPWKLQVSCTPLADPGLRVAGWKNDFKLLEAVTDKGDALQAAGKEPPSALRHSDETAVGKRIAQRMGGFQVLLRVPESAPEKIARLRGVATAQVAQTWREYPVTTFLPLEKAKAGDDEFEVALVDTEGGNQYQPELTLLVRPKKMKPEELADLPVRIELRYKGLGEGQSWSEVKVVEKGVEYRVRWWPFDYGRFGAREARPDLEALKVVIPQGFLDRPVYLELTDIPLK